MLIEHARGDSLMNKGRNLMAALGIASLWAAAADAATQAWVTRTVSRVIVSSNFQVQIILSPADVPDCRSNQVLGGVVTDYFNIVYGAGGVYESLDRMHEMALAAIVAGYPVTIGYDKDTSGCIVNYLSINLP
jgi:hypothetical protein